MLESNKSTDNYVPGEVHFADDDEHRKTSWKSWAAVGACVIAIYAQVASFIVSVSSTSEVSIGLRCRCLRSSHRLHCSRSSTIWQRW